MDSTRFRQPRLASSCTASFTGAALPPSPAIRAYFSFFPGARFRVTRAVLPRPFDPLDFFPNAGLRRDACDFGLGAAFGAAALAVGVSDTGFKYFAPEFGAFFIYALTMAILLIYPRGIFGRA